MRSNRICEAIEDQVICIQRHPLELKTATVKNAGPLFRDAELHRHQKKPSEAPVAGETIRSPKFLMGLLRPWS